MSNPASSYDVAVVGLGAAGAAALYQLAKRGGRAIGIDRFRPPHDQGSTHGETRITRQAIGEGAAYVPLALRAHEIWRELEAETGERLLVQNGCLILGRKEETSEGAVRNAFMTQTRDAARQYGLAHELLDATEVRRRYPQFTPQEDTIGYFEPGGGYLNPERCVAAQLTRAEALGVHTRLGTVVRSLERDGGGVRILTDGGDILAGQVIVTAGAWAPGLLGAPFDRLLSPTRQVMHWFPVVDHAAHWIESPVYIWAHGPKPNDFFYGFPSLPGSGTVKAAGEQYDASVDPDRVERRVGAGEAQADYSTHFAGRLSGLRPEPVKSVTCLYTVTPDSNFLIDRHPENERILVASPCSGHGFKHSAAVGEALAQVVSEGQSRIDLSAFALSRFQ